MKCLESKYDWANRSWVWINKCKLFSKCNKFPALDPNNSLLILSKMVKMWMRMRIRIRWYFPTLGNDWAWVPGFPSLIYVHLLKNYGLLVWIITPLSRMFLQTCHFSCVCFLENYVASMRYFNVCVVWKLLKSSLKDVLLQVLWKSTLCICM